jgi:hypothetical protein
MTESEAKEVIKRLIGISPSERIVRSVNMATEALEEIQQYRAIGTVEECREAKEKQIPKNPIEYEDKYYGCPNCGNPVMHKWEKYPNIPNDKSNGLPYCLGCGQNLDWSDTD